MGPHAEGHGPCTGVLRLEGGGEAGVRQLVADPEMEGKGILCQSCLALPQAQNGKVLPPFLQSESAAPGETVLLHVEGRSADADRLVQQRAHNGEQNGVPARPAGWVSLPDILQAGCVPQGDELPALVRHHRRQPAAL